MGLNRDWQSGLTRFLVTQTGAERVSIESCRRLAGGAIQQNYVVDATINGGEYDGRQRWVLRTDAPSQVAVSHNRPQEFTVLEVAHATGVSVPTPLWACIDRAVIGRAFYIMQWLPGVAAGRDVVRAGFSETQRSALVERLGRELARLHRVRPPSAVLAFLPLPDVSPASYRVRQYRHCLDALPDPHPILEWGLRWLDVNAVDSDAVVLCHADYRTGNYLVDKGLLTGILDWEFASWSDRHEDLAWFCARCWRFGAWQREAGGVAAREPFYRGYEEESATAVDHARIAYWEVMAAVRWAVIALQQGMRHCSGAESSLELALTGRMVPEMELDVLQQIESIESGRRRFA